MLTSQSFASILAVSEESGGQEDSKFDKPKSGAGSSASWKVDESIESFVKGWTIIKHVVIAEELSFDDDKDDVYCIFTYCMWLPVSWWSDSGLGWMLWWLTAEKLWNVISLKLAKYFWFKVWKGHCCPRSRKDICLIPTFPCPWFLLIWTKS